MGDAWTHYKIYLHVLSPPPPPPLQEIARVMQGVELLIGIMSSTPSYYNMFGRRFYKCLMEDTLMENCKALVVRIVNKEESSRPRLTDPDQIMQRHGLDPARFGDKLRKLSQQFN